MTVEPACQEPCRQEPAGPGRPHSAAAGPAANDDQHEANGPVGRRPTRLRPGVILIARRVGPVAITRPERLDAYRGVLLQLGEAGPDGAACFDILLAHPDPALDVVLVRLDESDAVAEWRALAAQLCLPLMAVGEGGRRVALERRLGPVALGGPSDRRAGPLTRGRRPRFLVRRKTARLPSCPLVHRSAGAWETGIRVAATRAQVSAMPSSTMPCERVGA